MADGLRFELVATLATHGIALSIITLGEIYEIYLMVTGLKGTSSMKIHRGLGIWQATA